jgi:hypothetical protein
LKVVEIVIFNLVPANELVLLLNRPTAQPKLIVDLVSGDFDEAWDENINLFEDMSKQPLYTLGEDEDGIKALHGANLQSATYAGMALVGPIGVIIAQYSVNN